MLQLAGIFSIACALADAHSQPPPLTDFIISTPSSYAFHSANLKQFPEHYPLYARLLGPGVVAWLTDSLGAGMWYVTMVKFGELVSGLVLLLLG